jgi:hypothetical protein
MPDMSDSIQTLLLCAEEIFGEVLNDIEPYNRPEHVVHMLFFRRFTEWQLNTAALYAPSTKQIAFRALSRYFAAWLK